jgi:hypothetical protein
MTLDPSGRSGDSATSIPIDIDFSALTERDAALPRGRGAGRLARFRAYHRKLAAVQDGRPDKTDAEWIAEAAGSSHAREMLAKATDSAPHGAGDETARSEVR